MPARRDSGGDSLKNQIDVSRANIFARNRNEPAPSLCSILLVQGQCSAASYSNLAPADRFLQGARGDPSIAVKGFYWRVRIDIDAI
jgi:hypothetical protein